MADTEKSILLVDDNPLFVKLLVRAFTNAGLMCITAFSAHEAIQLLEIQVPAIILSDYEMPEMNGMEFRRYLLSNIAFKDIPFVFLTSVDDKTIMETGLDLQAIDYVIKDTPVSVIVAKLKNLLHTVKKQRELSEQEIRKAAAALNIRAVPDKAPHVNGFDITFWHKDFQDIPGGDFIDFIEAGDRYMYILLGDIMGKKWNAWFFTFSYLSYIRAAVRFSILNEEHSTATILQKVNHIICQDDMLTDILSSLSLIRVDRQTGQLFYSGAGDLPLLHYDHKAAQLNQVSSSGLLLGLFAEGNYEEQEITLADNDRLFIFTDGITDYVVNDGKKSDYHLFASELQRLMLDTPSFNQLKNNLIQNPDALVDDCSIIQIQKIVKHD